MPDASPPSGEEGKGENRRIEVAHTFSPETVVGKRNRGKKSSPGSDGRKEEKEGE